MLPSILTISCNFRKSCLHYKFKNERSGYMDCSDGSEKFNLAANFVFLWMRPEVDRVGCSLKICGSYEHFLVCKYSPPSKFSHYNPSPMRTPPLFENNHFFKLCANEFMCWSSCDRMLDEKCKAIVASRINGENPPPEINLTIGYDAKTGVVTKSTIVKQ